MRKGRTVFTLITLLIVKAGFAQRAKHIEQQLDSCLQKAINTLEMTSCEGAAYKAWDEELNKYYQLLQSTLREENKNTLKEAQRKWIAYRDQEFELIDAYCFSEHQGTMWNMVSIEKRVAIVKARALELKNYYEGLKE